MKITGVKTFGLHHDVPTSSGPSTFYYRSRSALLVRIDTDEGLVGWGETAVMSGVRAVIDEQLAPLLIGSNPMAYRSLWHSMWGPNFGNGVALGGVDMALNDLRGKFLGLPVSELFGGRMRERVAAYASTMNYIEGKNPLEHYPDEAADMVGRGFRALKMRLGGQSLFDDVAAAEAVRSAVGPSVKLMADGNGAYTMHTAIQMGRELERLSFYWFEEPLPQSTPDYAGYEVLTEKLDIAIAAGEGLTSRGMFKEVVARRAMDIVQPDISLCGGIAEAIFVAELARLWGMQCMPHCWGGGLLIAATVHLLSLMPNASWSRYTEEPMLEIDMQENPFRVELLTEPMSFSDGFITVPQGHGLGVTIDEDKVEFYSRSDFG